MFGVWKNSFIFAHELLTKNKYEMETKTTTITITKKKNGIVELKNDQGMKLSLPMDGQLMAMSSAISFSVTEQYRKEQNKLLGKSFKLTLTIEELS